MCKKKKQGGAGISDLPITYYACCTSGRCSCELYFLAKRADNSKIYLDLCPVNMQDIACLVYLPVMYLLAFK